MNRLLRFIDNLSTWSAKLFSFLVGLIIIIITYEVVARYVFNSPTIWANEAATYLCGIFAVIAGAYTYQLNGHVKVDLFYARLQAKKKALIDVLTFPFIAVYFVVLVWLGSVSFWESIVIFETSGTSWSPPVYPLKLVVPISAALLLLQGLSKFVKNFITILNNHTSPKPNDS